MDLSQTLTKCNKNKMNRQYTLKNDNFVCLFVFFPRILYSNCRKNSNCQNFTIWWWFQEFHFRLISKPKLQIHKVIFIFKEVCHIQHQQKKLVIIQSKWCSDFKQEILWKGVLITLQIYILYFYYYTSIYDSHFDWISIVIKN